MKKVIARTYTITIDNEEDYRWLNNLLSNGREKVKRNPSKFMLEAAQTIQRLANSIESADVIEIVEDVPEPPKKPRAAKGDVFKPNLCKEHPTNTMQRAPRTDCDGCWKAYKKLNPTRYHLARSNFERTQKAK